MDFEFNISFNDERWLDAKQKSQITVENEIVSRDNHVSKLESAVQYLYTSSKRAISNHVYGNWEPMINELLVCAAIIC